MIFASDLDRTLIYSSLFLKTADASIQMVETYEGKDISYMTPNAVAKLKKLCEYLTFVPVTTRSLRQFSRIHLFQEVILEYTIVANGGIVLVRGEPDNDWQKHIKDKLSETCLAASELLAAFSELKGAWVLSGKEADGLFYWFIVDTKQVPWDELNDFSKMAGNFGWDIVLQGRKLYFMPKVINKGAAVQYVRQLSGKRSIAAAGDSVFDDSMLALADFPVVPRHGDISAKYELNNIGRPAKITKQSGIAAAEEILDYVESVYSHNKKVII